MPRAHSKDRATSVRQTTSFKGRSSKPRAGRRSQESTLSLIETSTHSLPDSQTLSRPSPSLSHSTSRTPATLPLPAPTGAYPDPRNPHYIAELDEVYRRSVQRISDMRREAKRLAFDEHHPSKLHLSSNDPAECRKRKNTLSMARTRRWRQLFTQRLYDDTERRCERYRALRAAVDHKHAHLARVHAQLYHECLKICEGMSAPEFSRLPDTIRNLCESFNLGPIEDSSSTDAAPARDVVEELERVIQSQSPSLSPSSSPSSSSDDASSSTLPHCSFTSTGSSGMETPETESEKDDEQGSGLDRGGIRAVSQTVSDLTHTLSLLSCGVAQIQGDGFLRPNSSFDMMDSLPSPMASGASTSGVAGNGTVTCGTLADPLDGHLIDCPAVILDDVLSPTHPMGIAEGGFYRGELTGF